MLPLNKIRALLVEHEIRVKDIARAARVSPTTVSIVLTGRGRSRHIQAVVAGMLGAQYETLWGREESPKKKAA